MLYPSINELRKKVDSKYTLVILAAKRSRDLIDGKLPLVDIGFSKPVSIATHEIAENIISYTRAESEETENAGSAAETEADSEAIEEDAETEEFEEPAIVSETEDGQEQFNENGDKDVI